ncbi:hypothetical protein LCGC14_1894660 [marine sediment metagenome]|uniref:Uncharacterized protein n=1 Tax=marine sediment metagenome TaxID=412755 RepID=A0A0F9ICA0_9ZZZZ
MKHRLLSLFTISMSVAFLWHFSNILIHGSHFIIEPSFLILMSEILLLVGILMFGIHCLFKEL